MSFNNVPPGWRDPDEPDCCPECGTELKPMEGECPECGWEIPEPDGEPIEPDEIDNTGYGYEPPPRRDR
jgi:tRNA(Ile2) C34 agmatinyltransferase TiaS